MKKSESTTPPARPDFENSIVIVSNADLDGFREGDGDLMDKMVGHLNSLGVPAVRVVQTSHNVPDDKRPLFRNGQLTALSDAVTSKLPSQKELQGEFLKMLDTQYAGKDVTLYVGSRINVAYTEGGAPVLAESGSLFTKDFLQELKSRNVKIAVNCLEFDFFGRSPRELPRQAEMLRQQLFEADKIHFLNEYDQLGFDRTVRQLSDDPHLRLHPQAERLSGSEAGHIDLSRDIGSLGREALLQLPQRGVFVSGIYTVDPLTDRQIMERRQSETDTPMDVLSRRPPNVLCFGLIRGEKGIDEAIKLGHMLQEGKQDNKVIIAGKFMGSFLLCQKIMKDIYRIDKPADLRGVMQTVLNDHLGVTPKLNLNKVNYDTIFTEHFHGDYDSFNAFAAKLDTALRKQYPERGKNIELHFNVPEDAVRDLAMDCRYAIKLDHKGMANNASTIVSCLGFYLPTFTSVGMVTGNDFRDPSMHEVHGIPSGSTTTPHRYQHTVIMPPERYSLEGGSELKPVNPPIDMIHHIITTETKEEYLVRLQELQQLHEDGVFDSRRVTIRLLNSVFTPLNSELLQARGVDISLYERFAVEPDVAQLVTHTTEGSRFTGTSDLVPETLRREQPFIRQELREEQRGWNCGDIALGVNREELVGWLNTNAENIELRGLLAPEIRTAAMMTALMMNQTAEAPDLDKQKRLAELLEINDALGGKDDTEVTKKISELLEGKATDPTLQRLALPESMCTREVQTLVNNYEQAHTDIQLTVAECNDLLGNPDGHRWPIQELDRFFLREENCIAHPEAYLKFSEARELLTPHERALDDFCNRQDVFQQYVNDHYGAKQWMVYHPHSGGQDNSSIMDVVAMKERTQVNVYVLRGGEYVLDHQTQQYGEGVRNVLYNGVNHYVQLQPNPAYVEPAVRKEAEEEHKERPRSDSLAEKSTPTATTGVPLDETHPSPEHGQSWDGVDRRTNTALRQSLEGLEQSGGHEAVRAFLDLSLLAGTGLQGVDANQQSTGTSHTPTKKQSPKGQQF